MSITNRISKLFRQLMLISFAIAMTACTSTIPKSPVTETTIETTPSKIAVAPSKAIPDLKMTVLYDNTTTKSTLQSHWGFAILLQYGVHTILFDTGHKGDVLIHNMTQLGIDPKLIDAVILSHEHRDHIGGLQTLLDTGVRPVVYVPSAFKQSLKSQISSQTKLLEISNTHEVLPGIYITEPIGSVIEQSLIIDTSEGAVVITGCAHPGIPEITQQVKMVTKQKIRLLAGGFHLMKTSREDVQAMITLLRTAHVESVLPTHCTGDEAINLFRSAYGDKFIEGGVGRIIIFGKKTTGGTS